MKVRKVFWICLLLMLGGCGSQSKTHTKVDVSIVPREAIESISPRSSEDVSKRLDMAVDSPQCSEKISASDQEPVTIRIYCTPDNYAWYCEEKTSAKSMLADTAKLMDEYNQIAINDLWYEGNKLCIDLDASVKQKMGSDCFSDEALKNLLARTFFSFPSVEEIELLVEGEKGYFGEKEVLTVPAEVASPDWKTAAVRYYFYRGQSFEQEYAYSEKLITYADLVQDTIKNMNEYCGIKITAIWYEGNKICVDLDESEVYKLDAGSTAGWIETYVLLETFSSYPNVKEIEILIGGQKGMSGEHFSFNEVFVVIG